MQVDDEDEGVVASFKIPKVEDARNGDDGNQGIRASNPKHKTSKKTMQAEHVMKKVSKAGPATVRRWQALLAKCEVRLAKVHSKYKHASGKKARNNYRHQ